MEKVRAGAAPGGACRLRAVAGAGREKACVDRRVASGHRGGASRSRLRLCGSRSRIARENDLGGRGGRRRGRERAPSRRKHLLASRLHQQELCRPRRAHSRRAGQAAADRPGRRIGARGRDTQPPRDENPVRLAHLLEHTAGLDDLHFKDYAHNDPAPLSLRQGLEHIRDSLYCRWPPGPALVLLQRRAGGCGRTSCRKRTAVPTSNSSPRDSRAAADDRGRPAVDR